jgi:hypothetical protein
MAPGSNSMAPEARHLASVLEEPAPEFIIFLRCALQARLLFRACPAEAAHYKSCARYWLTMAHRAQGPHLP